MKFIIDWTKIGFQMAYKNFIEDAIYSFKMFVAVFFIPQNIVTNGGKKTQTVLKYLQFNDKVKFYQKKEIN